MKAMNQRHTTIIGLFGRGRELGYAVFEGAELVRFGVKTIRGRKTDARLRRVLRRFLSDLLLKGEEVPTVAAESQSATIRNTGALRRVLRDVLIELDDVGARFAPLSLAAAKTLLCGDENATHRILIAAVETRFPILCRGGRKEPVYGLPEGSVVCFAIALAETCRREAATRFDKS